MTSLCKHGAPIAKRHLFTVTTAKSQKLITANFGISAVAADWLIGPVGSLFGFGSALMQEERKKERE
jgi:hypothetical protein